MKDKPAWDVIKKKVERQEMKEKFVEYLHIAEVLVLLIIIVSAMIYQYTDFIKAHTSTWIKELGLYFLSAVLSYFLMMIFRWPIFMRRNTDKITNAWTVNMDPKEIWKGRWNTIKNALLLGVVTVIIIFFCELSGTNNLVVSTIGTGDTSSGCEIYNEMKFPVLSDWSCNPPSNIPATGMVYLFILCFVLFLMFGFCFLFLEHKYFLYWSGFFGLAFLLIFGYYVFKYSPTTSATLSSTTTATPTTSITSITSITSTPSTTEDTTAAEEDTILNLKNNYIGYTLISGGVTYVLIAFSAILVILFIMMFGIHTTNFYSYFAGWENIKGWKLHVGTFFRFIVEAISVAFVMTWPFMRTVINRNKFFNPQYKWQSDSTARELFFDVWLKITLFYIFLQLAGNFEWANKGYCRSFVKEDKNGIITIKPGPNIVKSCHENDPIENFIEENESMIKLQLYIDKLNLKNKKPKDTTTCPVYSVVSPDVINNVVV
jgi:hypothetical protein